MSFNDIFKSSFLEDVSAISIVDMALALVLAFGLGVFIFLVYKKTYAGVMYSSSFGVTLVALTMITTLVILAVTSNVVLSLGMVGALSIVLPFLGYRGWNCPSGGDDSAGGLWQRVHRDYHPDLCKPQGYDKSVYCGAGV